jgi:predicted metal-dependent hydrolase
VAEERDRRDDGRPEQTRPRDRTGRPLPYGTTDVPLTEDHDPATVEEALLLGVALWNDERLFEAHECLEHVWHASPDDDRDLWQGVIQVAVAGVHLQRGNLDGAIATFEKAHDRLVDYPDVHRGIDVEQLVIFCEGATDALRDAGAVIEVGFPEFPVMDDGPWFTPDPGLLEPPGTPTPIPDGPAWRRPPRGAPEDHDPPDAPGASP